MPAFVRRGGRRAAPRARSGTARPAPAGDGARPRCAGSRRARAPTVKVTGSGSDGAGSRRAISPSSGPTPGPRGRGGAWSTRRCTAEPLGRVDEEDADLARASSASSTEPPKEARPARAPRGTSSAQPAQGREPAPRGPASSRHCRPDDSARPPAPPPPPGIAPAFHHPEPMAAHEGGAAVRVSPPPRARTPPARAGWSRAPGRARHASSGPAAAAALPDRSPASVSVVAAEARRALALHREHQTGRRGQHELRKVGAPHRGEASGRGRHAGRAVVGRGVGRRHLGGSGSRCASSWTRASAVARPARSASSARSSRRRSPKPHPTAPPRRPRPPAPRAMAGQRARRGPVLHWPRPRDASARRPADRPGRPPPGPGTPGSPRGAPRTRHARAPRAGP